MIAGGWKKGHRPILDKFERRTVGSKNRVQASSVPNSQGNALKSLFPLVLCDRGSGRPNPSYLHRPGHWSHLPQLAAPAVGERRTSFLRSVVSVRACMLWCAVWMVGAAPGRINLSNSNPTSAATFTVASRSWWQHVLIDADRQLGLLVLQIWWNLFLDVSLALVVTHDGDRAEWGGCYRARILIRRRWICRCSLTSSVGCGGSWSKAT
jgi:hypothetical protein